MMPFFMQNVLCPNFNFDFLRNKLILTYAVLELSIC